MKQNQPPHPYTGPRVLVPLNVEALVVTRLINNEKIFSTAPRSYVSLSRYGSLGPMPFAYGTGGPHPLIGVTLHWVLPDALKHGVARIAKTKRLSPDRINTNVANILRSIVSQKLPGYFHEISKTIDIGDNLRIKLIGRQALITLKLFAATPSYSKHTNDLRSLKPKKNEIEEALRFILSIDDNSLRREDLGIVLKEIGFELNEFIGKIKK